MGSRYVEVSRKAMMDALDGAGFSPDSFGGELVYTRRHQVDPTMVVKIYTSMPAYDHGGARACGEDAIRVVLIFENAVTGRSGGLYKASRVYRTGSEQAVIERTLDRARECYAEANRRVREHLERKARK